MASGTALIEQLLERVNLKGFEHKFPRELSGGMQQRASIVRSLAVDPSVLLMDEPFGALDAFTRDEMNLLIQEIWIETRKTIAFVTHSISEAIFLADRVMVMKTMPGGIKREVAIGNGEDLAKHSEQFEAVRRIDQHMQQCGRPADARRFEPRLIGREFTRRNGELALPELRRGRQPRLARRNDRNFGPTPHSQPGWSAITQPSPYVPTFVQTGGFRPAISIPVERWNRQSPSPALAGVGPRSQRAKGDVRLFADAVRKNLIHRRDHVLTAAHRYVEDQRLAAAFLRIGLHIASIVGRVRALSVN